MIGYFQAKLNEYFCKKNNSVQSSKKIFLIGFMGSGKTTIGKKLATKLKLPFIDLDEAIVRQEKKSIVEIFECYGEDYFRIQEKKMLAHIIKSNEAFVLATGGGTPCFFDNMDVMNQTGITFYLNYTPAFLTSRLLQATQKRPLLKNVLKDNMDNFIASLLKEREIFYKKSQFTISKINPNPSDFLTFFKPTD